MSCCVWYISCSERGLGSLSFLYESGCVILQSLRHYFLYSSLSCALLSADIIHLYALSLCSHFQGRFLFFTMLLPLIFYLHAELSRSGQFDHVGKEVYVNGFIRSPGFFFFFFLLYDFLPQFKGCSTSDALTFIQPGPQTYFACPKHNFKKA